MIALSATVGPGNRTPLRISTQKISRRRGPRNRCWIESRAESRVRRRTAPEEPAREPRNQQCRRNQDRDSRPLPQRNTEDPARPGEGGETLAQLTEAKLHIEFGYLGNRHVREFPDRETVAARPALKQNVDLRPRPFDAPDEIPVARKFVVGVAFGGFAQLLWMNP